ncbi:acyl dehydratase [Pseudochelatococcus lubricantis]|uniref:Acyl dehydratase n=1 Tax=Pseudochelatococcus lubricantis TaxID=1538102 RepID=A0ABX0V332_9HYPH|nr:MaoC/PaaZ C-terminal domain-containing protein [Pseudochelatococcus lubricantis]NIJ58775.1 acyl dehydratase [Pseudochelatococcus lubricantis]
MKHPETFHDLIGLDLGTQEIGWTEKDAILYALACGARAHELDLVYERDLRPLPGLVSALGLWAVERCGDLGVYDRKKSLHVSQGIDIHAHEGGAFLPRSARFPARARVAAVWDKGKATIVEIEVTSVFFSATYSIFLPGIGGWGGLNAPAPAKADALPALAPLAEYATSPEQAVLYRLTGDLHPVHVDPEIARGYGFDRPILHGLCTLGIALKLLGPAFGDHPAALQAATARLSSPVLPGDVLTLRAAPREGGVAFDVVVGDRQVLKDGWARYAPGS